MRRVVILLIALMFWGLLGSSTCAPAAEMTLAVHQTEEEEEEEPPPAYTKEELDWLARLVHAEAKGEPLAGKIAVANVVINRTKSPNFPDSIQKVIFQKVNGRYQFCPVANGSIYAEPAPEAIKAAKLALEGKATITEAVYFYNPKLASSSWIRTRPVINVIGNHNFAS
ncbi:MAG: cell wall hydrolase [bacterium]|jgi:N-acetylmuramoyl-L-alanine amidase